jgi:hypothetical protein
VSGAQDLPDGAILVARVEVFSYLDPAEPGETMRYSVNFEGDAPLTTLLGLLELAKFDLIGRDPA